MQNISLRNAGAISAIVGLALTLAPAPLLAQTGTGNIWGAEQRHIDNVFGILQKAGSRQDQFVFGNESIGDSTIDLREYMGHRCFHIAGNELAECTSMFGPFADLQKTLLDGALIDLVREKYPDKEELRTLLTAVRKKQRELKQQILDLSVETPQEKIRITLQTDRLDRRQAVWDICKNRNRSSIRAATLCFIQNHRLVTDLTVRLSPALVH